MKNELTIGRLAEVTGVPTKTIRYYEHVGILPPPRRSESRYRLYSQTDVRRLELIRRARLLDMALPEVRELVERAGRVTCDDFQDRFLAMVHRKREKVDRRIQDLQALREDLGHLTAHLAAHPQDDAHGEHTMLTCSPETCACLGNTK